MSGLSLETSIEFIIRFSFVYIAGFCLLTWLLVCVCLMAEEREEDSSSSCKILGNCDPCARQIRAEIVTYILCVCVMFLLCKCRYSLL